MRVEVSRQALAALNGMSNTSSNTEWKKKPTTITLPTNAKPSFNPYGQRSTQRQTITNVNSVKRPNPKPADEPQSKRRKLAPTPARTGAPINLDSPAVGRGRQNDSTNTRNTSEDELDVIPSNTSPERYHRADEGIQGALPDDPIEIDDDSDSPVKRTKVKVLTDMFEKKDLQQQQQQRKPLVSAKGRMKPRKGVAAPIFQTRPLPDETTLCFEDMSCVGSRQITHDGAGRLTWTDGLEISTTSGTAFKLNLENDTTCKSIKFWQRPEWRDKKKQTFLEIILRLKEYDCDDGFAFWFSLSGQHGQEQFSSLIDWLAKFKRPDVCPDHIKSKWESDVEEGEGRGTTPSNKVSELIRLRNGEPSLWKSQKHKRYTPEPDPLVAKKDQQPASTTSISTRIPAVPVRRSARQSTISAPPKDASEPPAPVLEPDKVILSYPQGAPGAVNVTNADLARLRPGEFLNDTLIEFGLKLWLKDVEGQNPELASQIHIFNSFFYKKLNQQKKGQQGYDSVKKWTSKFDIFQKKFIIVPINENMHWYLAIIYEPEHVLREEVPAITHTTRQQAKTLPTETVLDEDEKETDTSHPEAEPESAVDAMETSSEGEVERDLNISDFQISCSIQGIDGAGNEPKDADAMSEGNHSDLSYVTDPQSKVQDVPMQVQQPDEPVEVPMHVDEPQTSSPEPADDQTIVVPATSFYRRRHKKMKSKEDEVEFVEPVIRTHIFIFDSLGIRHTAVAKNLNNYLKMEALDKKGIANASNSESKTASVPTQPNFCDCGLYLLHFAKVFMTDPTGYFKHIVSPKPKMSNAEFSKLKKERWRDAEVPAMRGSLKQRVMELSAAWLKDRPTSKMPPAFPDASTVEDSDSDVDIVESKVEPKGKQKEVNRTGQR